jgi:8-oxo-dGTP pyrophosphatase MutT (NUDIX family)
VSRPSPLPPALVERARAHARGNTATVPTRDASTVVLMRDGARGVEVYLLRRVASMAFAAGMYVFPGGVVDPRDEDRAVRWGGPDDHAWAAALGADAGLARALVCAAVRETFEESGVLLAGPSAEEIVADTTGEDWENERVMLLDRSLAFVDLLARRDLVVRTDLLRAWTHWITPEFEERRYDTRFFVTALPVGQRTRDVGGEADRVAWMRPADALAAVDRGEMAMLPPTSVTLGELAGFGTVADVLAAPRAVTPILPRAVLDGEDITLLLPGEEGYPAHGGAGAAAASARGAGTS